MLEFKKLSLEDIPVIREYFLKYPCRSCDLTIGGVFMWRDYFGSEYAIFNNTLIFKVNYLDSQVAFTCPVGEDFDGACEQIKDYCTHHSIPLIFCVVTDSNLKKLKKLFPDFSSHSERDWADYIYSAEALKTLAGRKYSAQRNHINKFKRLYPNSSFEKMTAQTANECIDFLLNKIALKDSESALEERQKVIEVLENFDAYGFDSGILRIDGEIAGFSCGEITGDTLAVHIEKANIAYDGVYQMLTNSYLQMFLKPEVLFVNREDDAGDEGLRKAKLAYHPIELLNKKTVTVNSF